MALAVGPGQKISGGGMSVPAYARVYCVVQPLPATAGNERSPAVRAGGQDANGQYLHFLYEGNLDLRARSGGNQDPSAPDFVPNKIVVEFDAESCFTVPFDGHLYLVGGVGNWKFGMFWHEVVGPGDYRPTLRTLRTYQAAGAMFTVPDFHTTILGSNSQNQFTLPTGDILEPSVLLPGSNITAGTQLGVINSTTVITGLTL